MKPIRIGKNLRPYLQKAKDSALLAIEVYNKPAIKFRSAGYIALMVKLPNEPLSLIRQANDRLASG
jgi:hypothetical protein